jgi:predicted site-specific integrase-resolvase
MEASVERVIVQVERRQTVQGSEFMVQRTAAGNREFVSMNPEPSTMKREASSMSHESLTKIRPEREEK